MLGKSLFLPLSILAVLAGLAACSRPTPYQPLSDDGGYAEQRIEENRYQVTFSGNVLTSRERVESYLLYRAAEITLQTGNDHFVMDEKEVEEISRYVTTYDYDGLRPGHLYHPYRTTWRSYYWTRGYDRGTTREFKRYRAFASIRVFAGPKPENAANAYDARDVIANLRSVIEPPDSPQ